MLKRFMWLKAAGVLHPSKHNYMNDVKIVQDSFYNAQGKITKNTNLDREDDYIPCQDGDTFSFDVVPNNTGYRVRVIEYDADKAFLRMLKEETVSSATTVTWTTSADASFFRFSWPKSSSIALYKE